MKKLFIALSVLAALFLTVVPLQANDGMPDRVPANQFTIPVICAIDETLDTLVAVYEVSNIGTTTAQGTRRIHWQLWTRTSVEIINDYISYTPYDVVTIAVGAQIIWKDLRAADLAKIAADLDNDGTNDHYVAYMTISDSTTSNHLVSKFYYADPSGGKATGVTSAGREYLTGTGYHPYQKVPTWAGGAPVYTAAATTSAAGFEAFNAYAYGTSRLREENLADPTIPASQANYPEVAFAFTPRWFLYTDKGENNIFIWKSVNTTASLGGASTTIGSWGITISVYNNEEDYVSRSIDLSEELNILDIKEIVPQSWIPTSSTTQLGGWLNIPMPTGRYASAVDFLAWNWQRAENSNATLNWSSLYEVNRGVGTMYGL